MARTTILPTDPGAVKVWSAKVAVDTANKMYFSKMTGTEDQALPVVAKTELESGPGDEVTTYLVVKLSGKPIEGAEKGEGREDKLSQYTHKMRIDKHRKLVNVGDIMTQKRVPFDIAKQAQARISDYLAEVNDQQITMNASGGRGTGPEISHYPVGYAGFPNAFSAPDSGHWVVGAGKTKATMVAGDKMSTDVIDRAVALAKKFQGGEGKAVRMTPVDVDGGKHFLHLMGTENMYDLRREVGDAGWLTLEKAKATQDGAKNPIFTGGSAYYNGVLLDEVQHYIRFGDYGAGGNVPASRSLFLGAHAVSVAHGMKGQKGVRYELRDSDLDHGEEEVIIARMVAGFDKNRYDGRDFGVISIDTAFTDITATS
jgi:N4-gp56 family major capsid protein